MATPVSAKIKVRIYGATSQTVHKDGSVSCDVLVHPDDLPALKASGLLDWDSTQEKSAAPAKYLTKEGEVAAVWAGVHYAVAAAKGDAVEAEEKPLEGEGEVKP